jgi:hypothetical protein
VRIAQQMSQLDEDVVRRVLVKRYRPGKSGAHFPSLLTLLSHAKHTLGRVDLFRCESILLHTRGILVVIDVCTGRLVGFGVEREPIERVSGCHTFSRAIAGQPGTKRISTDHDPPCFASTAGWPISACSTSKQPNRLRTHRSRIRSSSS